MRASALSGRLGRIVAASLPIGCVGTPKVDRRRRYRKIYELDGTSVLKAMDVALRKAHNIAFREWRSCGTPQQQEAAPAQRDPDLFRRCACGGFFAPGATVTRVMVTRCDREFSGKSNCSEVTPPLANDRPRLGE